MRQLPDALGLSAAAHLVLVVWVGVRADPPPPPPAAPRLELIEVTAPAPPVLDEPAPVELAFLDAATTAAIAPLPPDPAPDRVRPAPTARLAATATVPGTAPGVDTPPARPATGPSPWLHMRRPGDVTLAPGALPAGRWDDLEHAPAGTTPAADLHVETGKLAPSGHGRHRADEGVFTATVERDGSVSLKDRRNLQIHVALPRPRQIGRAIAAWYEDDTKPVGTLGTAPADGAARRQDHNVTGADTRPESGQTVAIIRGGFDVTDALMRRHGQDPYASKKLAFLDATRDERVQIGARHRAAQLAQAPAHVQRNLDALWATVADPVARRRALFELWDECAEPGTSSAAVADAGATARRLVIGFIRARLPAGTTDAFSLAELAALNAGRGSRAVFAPYAD